MNIFKILTNSDNSSSQKFENNWLSFATSHKSGITFKLKIRIKIK